MGRQPRPNTQKPKLLLFVTLSDRGGAQEVVYQLACGMQNAFEVTVGCGSGGPLVERLRHKGIRVVELPFVRNFHPYHDLRVIGALIRWLRQEKFDLVHTHSTKAGLYGRWAASLAGVPAVLFTAHGWAFTEGRPSWLRRLLAGVERLAAQWTTKIVCVSEHDRQLALAFHVGDEAKLVVIPNGVDPAPFRQAATSGAGEALRRAWGIPPPPERLVVAFVGRLAPQKDPENLLRALARLPQEVEAVLVGDGPLWPQVQASVRRLGLERRVRLLGERTDVPKVLCAADIFALPSRWEGLPLTVIEAMLAGLPVVATRVGGVPELVEDGVTGYLVPPNDPDALAQAISRLVADPAQARALGEAGRQRAYAQYTLDKMLAGYWAIYREVLSHKPLRACSQRRRQ